MKQNTSPVESLPILIVDTNIFGNLLDEKTLDDTFKILVELSKGYQLSISNITLQEIVSKGTKDVYEIIRSFKSFKKFEVDKTVLMIAGLMTCIGIKGNFDSIIAATSFLNEAVILTGNQKDFPEPCFNEIRHWKIKYKDKGNRTAYYLIHLLAVNINKTLGKFNKLEYVQEIMNDES